MTTYTAAAWQWQPTYNYYNPNELYHHGIMGMRWGKRHGPPYPLAPSAHSSEEKRLKSQNEGKLESWGSSGGSKNAKATKTSNRAVKKIDKTTKSSTAISAKASKGLRSSLKKKISSIKSGLDRHPKVKTALKIAGGIAIATALAYLGAKVAAPRVRKKIESEMFDKIRKQGDAIDALYGKAFNATNKVHSIADVRDRKALSAYADDLFRQAHDAEHYMDNMQNDFLTILSKGNDIKTILTSLKYLR